MYIANISSGNLVDWYLGFVILSHHKMCQMKWEKKNLHSRQSKHLNQLVIFQLSKETEIYTAFVDL